MTICGAKGLPPGTKFLCTLYERINFCKYDIYNMYFIHARTINSSNMQMSYPRRTLQAAYTS